MESMPKDLESEIFRSRSEERAEDQTAYNYINDPHGHGSEKTTSTIRKRRPPEKRKHQKDLETITSDIKEKESFIRSLKIRSPNKDLYAAERDGLYSKLREVKSEKDKQFQEKRKSDAQLKTVNQEVQLKHETIAKLKGKLMYKTAQKVDDVIRSLNVQLERPLKASEQRQVHQEIDCLQKSKETIKEFGENKKELDDLKERQKELRQSRDDHVKSITSFKQQEDGFKSQLQKLKRNEDTEWDEYRAKAAERDHIRREIGGLYDRKRDLIFSFQREQSAHADYVKEVREKTKSELKQNLLSDRRNQDGKKNREYFHIITEKKKPFDDEIKVCDKLLGYLEKLRPGHSLSSPQSDIAQEDEASVPSLLSEKFADLSDFMLVKSKSSYYNDANLHGIYSGVRRKTSKREKKRKHISPETNKKVVHHPSVLQQFLSLDIHPPTLVVEIAQVVVQITEKKESFERSQEDLLEKSSMKRAQSSPTLASYSFEESFSLHPRDAPNDSDASVEENKISLDVTFNKDLARSKWKHKSCPMLDSINNDMQENDIEKIATRVEEGERMSIHNVKLESSEDAVNINDENYENKSSPRVHFYIPKSDSQSSEESSDLNLHSNKVSIQTIELDKPSSELNSQSSEHSNQTVDPDTTSGQPNIQSIELDIETCAHDPPSSQLITESNELYISSPNKTVRTLTHREEKGAITNHSFEHEPFIMVYTSVEENKFEQSVDQKEESKPDQTDTVTPDTGIYTLLNRDSDVIRHDDLFSEISSVKYGRSKSQDSVCMPLRTLMVRDACKRLSGDFKAFQHVSDETVVTTEV